MDPDKKRAIIVRSVLAAVLVVFMVAYYIQEKNIDDKLNRCSVYTIGFPIRVVKNRLEFYYVIDDKKVVSSTSVGAQVVGATYNTSQLVHRNLWLKVFCDDPEVNRACCNIDMPDTLTYAPTHGWDVLPYGLKEKSKTIFDE